jgi:hypothetical protein
MPECAEVGLINPISHSVRPDDPTLFGWIKSHKKLSRVEMSSLYYAWICRLYEKGFLSLYTCKYVQL